MSNKVFLVCPFSNLEYFIRNKYGSDVFFITGIAGILSYRDEQYLTAIRDFIKEHRIQSFYVVNDTDCRFINNIIYREPLYGTTAENLIEIVYLDHFTTICREKTLQDQKFKLAEHNVRHQIAEVSDNLFLRQGLLENGTKIFGLVTTKSINRIVEISDNFITAAEREH